MGGVSAAAAGASARTASEQEEERRNGSPSPQMLLHIFMVVLVPVMRNLLRTSVYVVMNSFLRGATDGGVGGGRSDACREHSSECSETGGDDGARAAPPPPLRPPPRDVGADEGAGRAAGPESPNIPPPASPLLPRRRGETVAGTGRPPPRSPP